MEQSESPSAMCSSPTDEQAATPKASVQEEPELMMDSPITSPTSTSATTAPEPSSPDTKAQNTASSSSAQHKVAASAESSRSLSIHPVQKAHQQQQHQRQQSGDRTVRRRQGISGHRNSSFEYKETLDATTKHLEVSQMRDRLHPRAKHAK